MVEPASYSFSRYLQAKTTVDERARNQTVVDSFQELLADMDAPIRICEIGTGTGSMIDTVATWIPTDHSIEYTAIENDPTVLAVAIDRFVDDAEIDPAGLAEGRCRSVRPSQSMTVEFHHRNGLAYLGNRDREYDVLIAQSFMDLVDVEPAVGSLLGAVRPGGLAYFPFTFDGTTALLPEIDPELDRRIERRYHHHMDSTVKAGGYTGDSRAGRHLLCADGPVGHTVEAAGGSDWLVRPVDGAYPADEAYFLHYILNTISTALAGDATIETDELQRWTNRRHEQVDAAQLTYLTHQLDVLLRRSE